MSDAAMARSNVKSATMSAKIIRADGTEEDLGVIAEWHRNPFRRIVSALKQR